MATDAELLDAWRLGDEQAASTLLRKYAPSVHRVFRNTVPSAAKDLTQRTFMACVEGRDRVRDGTSFRAYLFGAARKQLFYFLRAKHGRDARIDPLEHSVADSVASPSQVVAEHEEQRLLLEALRRIPLDLQLAVELYYWEELSMEEIASVLDVRPGTVKSRLARARVVLRDTILGLETSDVLKHSTVDNLERWARGLRGVLGDEDS